MSAIECPLIPMGAITGRPEKAAITAMLSAYREVGITQFMIYARTGCELEYMSDEWLDTCEWIVEEANRLGFTSLWMYDEYNWPSGTCKQTVMKENHDFAMNQLCVYPENDGYKIVIRKNSGMTDLMSEEAVACFIRLTHEKYATRLGKYFGTLIKGFFTDEPDIAFFSREHEEDVLVMPYYLGLEENYAAQTGQDLHGDIISGIRNCSEFYLETCNRLFARRFATCFAEQMSKWCDQHHLLLTGHLMSEYSPRALVCNGHPLEVLSKFSLPGMDEIFTHGKNGTIEWQTLSTVQYAIEKQGNQGGVAVLFALGPCDLSFAKMKKQLWLCSAFGVDRFVMAVAALDMRGNVEKNQYFNPFTPDQPWFPALKEFGEEAAKIAGFAQKERAVQVNVRYPYTPAPQTDLLKHLVAVQCNWRLLLPDEEPDADIVLSLENGQIREEKSNQLYFDFGRLYDSLLEKRLATESWVSLPDGENCSDVFLQRYTDGTMLVVDLSQKNRQLMIHRGGQSIPFNLSADGVVAFPGWTVTLDRPNTLRAEFRDGGFEFELADSVEELRLSVRSYGDIPEVTLNGEAVTVKGDAQDLPNGFQGLYRQTDVLTLAPGKHRLELTNEAFDFPYLPSAFVTGPFSREENRLSAYREDGTGLAGYVGSLTQAAEVTIPVIAMKVRVDSGNQVTELILNGESLGRRLAAPFEWVLPAGSQGRTVQVELKRFTSCGPLFGTDCFAEATHWLGEYRPHNEEAPLPYCDIQFS